MKKIVVLLAIALILALTAPAALAGTTTKHKPTKVVKVKVVKVEKKVVKKVVVKKVVVKKVKKPIRVKKVRKPVVVKKVVKPVVVKKVVKPVVVIKEIAIVLKAKAKLEPEKGEKATGKAILLFDPKKDETIVHLRVENLEPCSSHAAHIHKGSCNGPIVHNLDNVVADRCGVGTSTTRIKGKIDVKDWWVNVHKDPQLPSPGITCGKVEAKKIAVIKTDGKKILAVKIIKLHDGDPDDMAVTGMGTTDAYATMPTTSPSDSGNSGYTY